MKTLFSLPLLLLSLCFFGCGKDNHTGFEKSNYDTQKVDNLTIYYSHNEEGKTEEKFFQNSDLTLKKTIHSEEFIKHTYQFKQKVIVHNLSFSKEEYPKYLNSQVVQNKVQFKFLDRINYSKEIGLCDEFQLLSQHQNDLSLHEKNIHFIKTEEKHLLEIAQQENSANSYQLKRKLPLCLKVPKVTYQFYLKNSESLEKNELIQKLKDQVLSTNWSTYQEDLPSWKIHFLGNLTEDTRNNVIYTLTLYHYFPLDFSLIQNLNFNWIQSTLKTDSRFLTNLAAEENLPLEFVQAIELIPYKVEESSQVHHPKPVMYTVISDTCTAFVKREQDEIHRKDCEKKSTVIKDEGYDLITRQDKIHFRENAITPYKLSEITHALFAIDQETGKYYRKSSFLPFDVHKSSLQLDFRTHKKHFDNRIEKVEEVKKTEQIEHIYQLEFIRHYDQWKRTNETIELSAT